MGDIIVSSHFIFGKIDNVELLLRKLKMNEKQRNMIEKMTREQTKSVVWRFVRMYRLTASNFGRVVRNGDPTFLLSDNEKEPKKTLPMWWGIKNENNARELYAQKHGVVVDKIGVLLSESGILGGTPDGIVKSERKLIEIKCPYTLALLKNRGSLKSRIESGSFWLNLNKKGDVDFNMKHPQGVAYYHQIQGCLYLANTLADTCDLIVWGPSDWLVVNVKKNDDWFPCYGAYLEQFWKARVAPKICSQGLQMVSVKAFCFHF